MGPDCFPVAWNEVNENEGNLEGEGEVEGGDKDLIATWSEEKNGGQIGHVLGGNSWENSLTVWVLLTRSRS